MQHKKFRKADTGTKKFFPFVSPYTAVQNRYIERIWGLVTIFSRRVWRNLQTLQFFFTCLLFFLYSNMFLNDWPIYSSISLREVYMRWTNRHWFSMFVVLQESFQQISILDSKSTIFSLLVAVVFVLQSNEETCLGQVLFNCTLIVLSPHGNYDSQTWTDFLNGHRAAVHVLKQKINVRIFSWVVVPKRLFFPGIVNTVGKLRMLSTKFYVE